MRIIIIQAAGMHDGVRTKHCKNDHLRECHAMKHAFEANGWEADIWGLRFPNFDTPPDFNSYDYLLTIENYELDWLPDFSKITKPVKMQWIIDLHCIDPEVFRNTTSQMDIVLHSTKSLMAGYEKLHPDKKHIWFPNGLDDRYLTNRNLQRTKDCIFVGNLASREPLLRAVEKLCDVKLHLMVTGEDMIKLVNSTKVNFNNSIAKDVNFRCFETMGCGACLLTNRLDELEELGFKDGVNCYMYEGVGEIPGKLALALDNWERVGKAGEAFAKEHTYTKRVAALITDLAISKPAETEQDPWKFYIIANRGATYAGVSPDPVRRLRQHNGEIKGGAKYTTSKGSGWRHVCLVSGFRAKIEALQFEWAVKHFPPRNAGGLKNRLLKLVGVCNKPSWTSKAPPASDVPLHIEWLEEPCDTGDLPSYVTQSYRVSQTL